MATISFKNINKIYDNNVKAVFDFNLEVKDKEFIVFVGPSGCGKSTTLRMIAGLEEITSGEISIDGVVVNEIAAKNRNIAMVFQNYALYPHMTVYDNMAFALKLRKVFMPVFNADHTPYLIPDTDQIKPMEEEIEKLSKNPGNEAKIAELKAKIDYLNANPSAEAYELRHYTKEEIDSRIKEVSTILGLDAYLSRKPAALSGGQRQRVALGRAIVRKPKVFLMDEPLSNLDAKLRVQMRSEIAKIHRDVGATTIYVTHDQTEAMTMASRIVIMKDGYIQQIGTPREVYNNPANMFVAGFIGSPSTNFIRGKFDGEYFSCKGLKFKVNAQQKEILKDYKGKEVVFGIRPEDVLLSEDPNSKSLSEFIDLVCDLSELLGHELIVYSYVGTQRIICQTSSKYDVETNKKYKFYLDISKGHFFDVDSTNQIGL